MEYIVIGSFIVLAAAFWVGVLFVLSKRGKLDPLAKGIFKLGLLSGSVALLSAMLRIDGLIGLEKDLHRFLSFGGMLFCAILLMDFAPVFLMHKASTHTWALGGIFSGLVAVPFISDLFGLSETFMLFGLPVPRFAFGSLAALIGIAIVSARTMKLTNLAFGQASQPSYKNRLLYWILSLGIYILGFIFVLLNQVLVGGLLNLAGFLTLSYVVTSGNPKDLMRIGAHSLRFVVVSLLTVGVYAAGFLLAEVILSELSVAQPALTALLLAAVFVLVLNPLVTWVAQRINNLVFSQGYNPSVIVRDYSQSIGNVVDLRLLKQISLSLIYRVLGINRGNLYLVDEVKEEGSNYFRLSPIRSGDGTDEAVIEGRLLPNSPVALHFTQLRRPLLQYELDFSSVYKSMLPGDREWLSLQNAEAFVPINTKTGWIGLYVLGPKLTGEKYSSEDLLLLSTLADQTAVALENARLFTDLSVVNRELQLAKVDLEMAYQQLREIDELKSSFIRVVTHELRTPLANMAFSLQILHMYGPQRWTPEQVDQVQQIESNLNLTRSMVDNLISFAAFFYKHVVLQLELLDFKTVTSDTVASLRKISDAKGIDLQVYFVGDLLPIRADKKLIADAIYQLIQNAIKFTPTGGKIWVTCWMATDLLYFDVKDTGVGVPRDKLKALWEVFSQASDPNLRGQEGLGLGLALVRFIVAAHGGKVWVESTSGEGSTFGFRIPLTGPGMLIDPTSTVRENKDITRPLMMRK